MNISLLSPFRRLCLVPLMATLVLISGCATAWHTTDSGESPLSSLIVQQPQDATVMAEQDATFTVSATGAGVPSYQWYFQGKIVVGATSTKYVISKATLQQTGAKVTVRVTDASTTDESAPATLTVKPLNPRLSLTPIPDVQYGAAPFAVNATSLSKGAITYSITSGPATVSGATVTVSGAGPVVVAASQVADGNYANGSASTTFNVGQNVQVSPITPADLTMAPGTVNYSATVTGGVTNLLSWSASGGSFAGSVWTSPNIAGPYTIIARSKDDPSKQSTTTVIISKPIITVQPTGGGACTNGPKSLNVGDLYGQTYQWALNSAAIPGATRPTYYLAAASASLDSGVYTVQVSNPAGSVTSVPAALSVGSTITNNPTSISVQAPKTATFTVAASGQAPFSYQWYVASSGTTTGVAIPGATQSSYTTQATDATLDGAQYYAVVTDSCGTPMTSLHATLTVTNALTPPVIDVQPVSLSILPGGAATFSIHALGSPTLKYQWYRVAAGSGSGVNAVGGTAIAGATSASYTLPASATTVSNDQDAYYAIVTNPYGQAGSLRATLAVGGGIMITKQPSTLFVNTGNAATFSVVATSALPLTYQWYRADAASSKFVAIPSETGTSYTLLAANASQNGSSYYVVVSNGVTASVQSATASLFVDQPTGASTCGWIAAYDAQALDGCAYQLTAAASQSGQIHWPTLVSTSNLTLSFTMTLSDTSPVPADGFAVVLADPTLGATPGMEGIPGWGLGAAGVPGLAITFDDYYNGPTSTTPGDPQIPCIGVTRSEKALFEAPFYMENSAIPALAAYGQSISHSYVITIIGKNMTVTMDGTQVLSGAVDVPSAAYLLVTAGTGAHWERAVISNLTATVQQ